MLRPHGVLARRNATSHFYQAFYHWAQISGLHGSSVAWAERRRCAKNGNRQDVSRDSRSQGGRRLVRRDFSSSAKKQEQSTVKLLLSKKRRAGIPLERIQKRVPGVVFFEDGIALEDGRVPLQVIGKREDVRSALSLVSEALAAINAAPAATPAETPTASSPKFHFEGRQPPLIPAPLVESKDFWTKPSDSRTRSRATGATEAERQKKESANKDASAKRLRSGHMKVSEEGVKRATTDPKPEKTAWRREPGREPEVNLNENPSDIDALRDSFRKLLSHTIRPLAIVTSYDSETAAKDSAGSTLLACRGATVSSVASVSMRPSPVVSLNLKADSALAKMILRTKKFSVHMLSPNEAGAEVSRVFGYQKSRPEEPFETLIERGQCRVMVSNTDHAQFFGPGVTARLECDHVGGRVRVGDHYMIFGQITDVVRCSRDRDNTTETALLDIDEEPFLAYAAGSCRTAGQAIDGRGTDFTGQQRRDREKEAADAKDSRSVKQERNQEEDERRTTDDVQVLQSQYDVEQSQTEVAGDRNPPLSELLRNLGSSVVNHDIEADVVFPSKGNTSAQPTGSGSTTLRKDRERTKLDAILEAAMDDDDMPTSSPPTRTNKPGGIKAGTVKARNFSTSTRPQSFSCSPPVSSRQFSSKSSMYAESPSSITNADVDLAQDSSESSNAPEDPAFLKQDVSSYLGLDDIPRGRWTNDISIAELMKYGTERIQLAIAGGRADAPPGVQPGCVNCFADFRIRKLIGRLHSANKQGMVSDRVMEELILGPLEGGIIEERMRKRKEGKGRANAPICRETAPRA